jgi:hypothetical protein
VAEKYERTCLILSLAMMVCEKGYGVSYLGNEEDAGDVKAQPFFRVAGLSLAATQKTTPTTGFRGTGVDMQEES